MKKYEVSIRVSRDDNSMVLARVLWGMVRAMVFANAPILPQGFYSVSADDITIR